MVRALGMRGLAWRQGTSKRIENIRKRFSSRGIVQTPRALHTGGLNLALLPQPLIAMPGHRLRPFYGPSHYQRRPGHHQAITKPALAIKSNSQALRGYYQAAFGHHQTITKPTLAITNPLPNPLWPLPSHCQTDRGNYQAVTKPPFGQ